jgi:hypothetical protein
MEAVIRQNGFTVGRIVAKALSGLARKKLAAFAEKRKDLPAPGIIAEFAERHPFLGRCGLDVFLPVLRQTKGVPEPEAVVQAVDTALRRYKRARARLAYDGSDAALYGALAAEKEYVAALTEAKKYWGWGVAEAVKKAVVGGWLR